MCNKNKEKPVKNKNLPFFTYGIFRPGEISFLGIKDYVKSVEKITIDGNIKVRDGVFLYKDDNRNQVEGYLLTFKEDEAENAYKFIHNLEPYKLFRWVEKAIKGTEQKFNILYGKNIDKGSESIREVYYDLPRTSLIIPPYVTVEDPYFTTGIKILKEFKENFSSLDKLEVWKLEPSFQIQMRYMFLWTIIERFTFFRYGLGKGPSSRNTEFSNNKYFVEALNEYVEESRKVYSTESPESYYVLNKDKPKNSINFYYQVRSNLTHRGKGIPEDFKIIKKSFEELLNITEYILKETKKECEQIKLQYEIEN